MHTFGSGLERNHGLALGLDLDGLARLDAVGRTIDDVAIDEDVAMDHELASLGGGAGEACTQDQSVETGLKIGQHGVAGLAGGVGALLVSGAELLLGDAVLGAKTLLLAQTHCVIGFSAATGAAVLARSIRTLFEDALSLRGQSDAEGAGKTHLTAGTLNVRHWFNPLFVLSLSERNVCRSPAYAEPASPVLLRAMRERLDPQCRTPRMAADPLMG